jgi:hypothetical protein
MICVCPTCGFPHTADEAEESPAPPESYRIIEEWENIDIPEVSKYRIKEEWED